MDDGKNTFDPKYFDFGIVSGFIFDCFRLSQSDGTIAGKTGENLFSKPFHSSGPIVSVIKTVLVLPVLKPIGIVRD